MTLRYLKLLRQAQSITLLVLCSAFGGTTRGQTDPIPALIKALQSEDRKVRFNAAVELNKRSPAAEEAIRALIRATKDDERVVSNAAIAALAAIGSPALPSLIRALADDEDPRVRTGVAAAIAGVDRSGLDAKLIVPPLLKAVNDPDPRVRTQAICTLGTLQETACITLLIQKLKTDSNADVRRAAAVVLGDFGSASKGAIPALVQAVNDPDPRVRTQAICTLGILQETACTTLLIQKLKTDNDADVRRAAAVVLGGFGSASKDAIPALIQALDDPDDFSARQNRVPRPRPTMSGLLASRGVQETAFEALISIGSAAVPALLELIKDPDRRRQGRTIRILGYMGSEAKAATPVLVEKLDDEDQKLRSDAAWSLGQIGPQASKAVPALTRALTDSSGEVRVTAATALKEVEPGNRDALPALIKELRDKTSDAHRKHAASALVTVGRSQEAAAAALVEALADADEDVASAALGSLREMVPCAEQAAYALFRAMRKPGSADLQAKAVQVLTQVQDDKIAVTALIEALQNNRQEIRHLAAHMLAAYGGETKAALPALTKALTDTSLEVRETAAKALEKIRRME